MQEVVKLIIGVSVLVLGYFLGNILRKQTLDEQKDGQKYFKAIVLIFLLLGFSGLLFSKDWLMFSSFFVAIVTSRSLIKNEKKK